MASHALLASALLLAPGPAPQGPEAAAAALFARAREVADAGDRAHALVLLGEGLALRLPLLRNLSFLQPIAPKSASREELRRDVLRELDAPKERAALRLMDRALKAFGIVAPVVDTRQLVTNLLAEEIAGFYDSQRKRLRVIGDVDGPIDLDKDRGVLAHELAHALADQHFDLEAMHQRARGDEDMSLATTAVIEGEAMLVMIADMRDREIAADSAAVFALPPGAIDALFTVAGRFAPELSGDTLRLAPPFFARTMLFPYHEGLVFVLRVAGERRWAAVDEVFRAPPLSTEQILHPEKYPSDTPRDFVLPEVSALLGRAWRRVGSDVLGEAQIAAMLEDPSAAAGWDGDRYVIYEDESGRAALAWVSVWDSEEDAQQLVRAYARYSDERARRNHALEHLPPLVPEGETLRRVINGRATLVQRDGDRVLIVEGLPQELTVQLAPALLRAQLIDKRAPQR